MKTKKIVKTTVGAIIVRNNKILLEKRANSIIEGNKWCIPGGHIDIGETAESALKREIKEELGASIKSIKFLGYFDEIIPEINNYAVVLVFKVKISGKFKLQKSEVSEVKWFSKEELSKIDIAFKNREIIKKYSKLK